MLTKIKKKFKKWFGKTYITFADYSTETELMTVDYDDGTTDVFKGSCTVWHKLPYFKRCSGATESTLCDLWHYVRHNKGPYPIAHIK